MLKHAQKSKKATVIYVAYTRKRQQKERNSVLLPYVRQKSPWHSL